jgi:tripartite-type tricarboxylate transporter receptor subunit TctC
MRCLKSIAVGLICSALPIADGIHVASAQEYPSKTVRIIVPVSPGGGSDLFARVIAKKLSETWGQSAVVENRPGGGAIIGSEYVARSAPDGYTLLLVASTHAINPSFYKKLPYDPIKDFALVGLVGETPNILVVHPSLPVRTAAQLIALAKKRPGELTFGSAGVGQTTHLASELFKSMAKIDVVHVPYKGSGAAEIDLAGGHVHYIIDSMPAAMPNVKSGKTRAVATAGAKRSPTLPEVPTVAESGLPGYEMSVWLGLVAPGGTATAIVSKINREVARVMAERDVGEILFSQGAEPRTNSPQEFAAYMKAQIELFAKIIANAGIKPE